jgi:enhancer of polycomb-like protein
LTYPLELAKSLLIRETLKKDSAVQSQDVWEKRLAFADLKLKFPTFNDKVDEELLVDKERPVKKSDTSYVTPGVCCCIYMYFLR